MILVINKENPYKHINSKCVLGKFDNIPPVTISKEIPFTNYMCKCNSYKK